MKIKLNVNPTFSGELYRVKFVDGVSQSFVDENTFNQIKFTLGLEPEVIAGDECENCKQHKVTIADLEIRIEHLEEKLRKKVNKE
jgi:hypothetical protein